MRLLIATALLASVLLAELSGVAHADVPAATIDTAKAAFEKLAERLAVNPADLPTLANPADAAVLQQLWNTDAVVAGRPHGAANIPGLMQWFENANTVSKAYLFASTGTADEAISRNLLAHPGEIASGQIFLLRASVSMLQALDDFLSKLPPEQRTEIRLAGKRSAVQGTIGQFEGLLMMVGASPSGDPHARRMSAACGEDMKLFAPFLTAAERDRLIEAVLATSANPDPVVVAHLGQALAALKRAK